MSNQTDLPNSDYEVGYGKPPKHTQFQKGQSGNSAGRPKKNPTDLEDIIKRAQRQKVTVTEGGQRVRKSKLEIAVTQMVNKATAGDPKALQMLLKSQPVLNATDQKQLPTPDRNVEREMARQLVARLSASRDTTDTNTNESSQPLDQLNMTEGHDHEI